MLSRSPRHSNGSQSSSRASGAVESTPEERIHELLETVLGPEIDQLQPTASPRSIEARKALSLQITQIAQQIHRTTKPRAGGSTHDERLIVRAQKLLGHVGRTHIAPIDLPTVMRGRAEYPKSSVGALEDIAIERVMRGYGDAADEEWVSLAKQNPPPSNCCAEQCPTTVLSAASHLGGVLPRVASVRRGR